MGAYRPEFFRPFPLIAAEAAASRQSLDSLLIWPPSNTVPTHTTKSPVTEALKTGGAAVLLCTGILFLSARGFFDIYEFIEGQPLEKPHSVAVGMMFIGVVLPSLVLAAIAFTFIISLSRCRTRTLGLTTALGALLVMTLPFGLSYTVRELRFVILLYPAPLLAVAVNPPIGWYCGSVIQLFLGGWLLGWLDRFISRNKLDPS